VYSPPSNNFCVTCDALAPIVTHVMPSTSILPLTLRQDEIGDAQVASLFLWWEAKSERFGGNPISQFPAFRQVVNDDVVAFTPGAPE